VYVFERLVTEVESGIENTYKHGVLARHAAGPVVPHLEKLNRLDLIHLIETLTVQSPQRIVGGAVRFPAHVSKHAVPVDTPVYRNPAQSLDERIRAYRGDLCDTHIGGNGV
jgi:hypothetical protein